MAHQYSVVSAVRNGTSTEKNPLVNVTGTVDGQTAFALVFWAQIQQSAAIGVSAVQDFLASVLLGFLNGAPYPEVEIPSSAFPPAVFTGNVVEPVPQALVGEWSQ